MSEQVKEPEKKSHWLEAFLIGVIALVFGLSVAFFPKMLTSIGFIVAAVVFFGVGITDIIASIKYKSEEGTTKSTLWAGLISVLAGAFMAVTIYVPSISVETVIIVLCVWAVLRCLLILASVIMGKTRRKGAVISSAITGIAGILVFLFRDVLMASTRIVGYVLMAIGVACVILGLYQRASERELKERAALEKKQAKKLAKEKSADEVNEPDSEDASQQKSLDKGKEALDSPKDEPDVEYSVKEEDTPKDEEEAEYTVEEM